jgi:hypothetical protein
MTDPFLEKYDAVCKGVRANPHYERMLELDATLLVHQRTHVYSIIDGARRLQREQRANPLASARDALETYKARSVG